MVERNKISAATNYSQAAKNENIVNPASLTQEAIFNQQILSLSPHIPENTLLEDLKYRLQYLSFDPHFKHNELLKSAIKTERMGLIDLLLKYKVDVNTKDPSDVYSPLYIALHKFMTHSDHKQELIEKLLKAGADPTQSNNIALLQLMHGTSYKNLTRLVRPLVLHGAHLRNHDTFIYPHGNMIDDLTDPNNPETNTLVFFIKHNTFSLKTIEELVRNPDLSNSYLNLSKSHLNLLQKHLTERLHQELKHAKNKKSEPEFLDQSTDSLKPTPKSTRKSRRI